MWTNLSQLRIADSMTAIPSTGWWCFWTTSELLPWEIWFKESPIWQEVLYSHLTPAVLGDTATALIAWTFWIPFLFHSGLITSRLGLYSQSPSSAWREFLQVKPSLILLCSPFSKLDLQKGYYQVPVAPKNVQKTAIITPFGIYEFPCMSFWLRNAVNTLQCLMDQVRFCLCWQYSYLQQVPVLPRQQHPWSFFPLLEAWSDDQIAQVWIHQAAYPEVPGYDNLLQEVSLGCCSDPSSFYWCFQGPWQGSVLVPYVRLCLYQSQWSSIICFWAGSPLCRCSHLSCHWCFQHPPGCCSSAAPGWFVSSVGVLLQEAVYAKKKYSAFNSELLAAYSSLCHFRFMLEATVFTIFTDHKLLTHALFRVSPTKSPRQQRHLFYLAIDYTYGQL